MIEKYNPVKYKKFEMFLEEVNNINSDKEVKLEDYADKVNSYKANSSKLKSVLTKPEDKWEEEANKIIDGNVYLGIAWKIAKIEKSIKTNDDKIKSGELSDEEVKEMQDKIKEEQVILNKEKNDLSKKIREDLHVIQTT